MKITDSVLAELDKCFAKDYSIMPSIDGKCFALNENGNHSFFECFGNANSEYYAAQRYFQVTPKFIIKVYHYYLIMPIEETGVWYRGTRMPNGNYEFDCCADSIEELSWSL